MTLLAKFAGVVAVVGCATFTPVQADEPVKFPTIAPRKIDGNDSAIQKLRKELFNEIATEVGLLTEMSLQNDRLLDALERLRRVGLEVSTTAKEKVALLTQLEEFADAQEKLTKDVTARVAPRQVKRDLSRIRQFRLEVQVEMLKLKEPEGK